MAALYRLTDEGAIYRTSDHANIPPDPLNNDYAEYLEWVEAGGVADPCIPSPGQIPDISRRQFSQQLAIQGIISEGEALAAVQTGALPASLAVIVSGLPIGEQFGAKMLLAGAATFERHHAMSEAIGAAYGWTSEQIDAFFVAASKLL